MLSRVLSDSVIWQYMYKYIKWFMPFLSSNRCPTWLHATRGQCIPIEVMAHDAVRQPNNTTRATLPEGPYHLKIRCRKNVWSDKEEIPRTSLRCSGITWEGSQVCDGMRLPSQPGCSLQGTYGRFATWGSEEITWRYGTGARRTSPWTWSRCAPDAGAHCLHGLSGSISLSNHINTFKSSSFYILFPNCITNQ